MAIFIETYMHTYTWGNNPALKCDKGEGKGTFLLQSRGWMASNVFPLFDCDSLIWDFVAETGLSDDVHLTVPDFSVAWPAWIPFHPFKLPVAGQ